VGFDPSGCGFGFSIRQHFDNVMTLQIDQERSIGASTLKRKIINAQLGDLSNGISWQRHDAPEHGMARGLYPESIGDTNAKPTARRQANDLHNLEQSRRHTGPRGHKGGQTLCEDFSWTTGFVTEKFAHGQQDVDWLPSAGKVGQATLIVAMNTGSSSATQRTRRTRLRGKQRNAHFSFEL
jgi:hypothetical protein